MKFSAQTVLWWVQCWAVMCDKGAWLGGEPEVAQPVDGRGRVCKAFNIMTHYHGNVGDVKGTASAH